MTHDMFIRHARVADDIDATAYPFNIPAVQSMSSIDCNQPVTFLVGENGSGKSTIVESIAIAAGFNAEGGSKNYHFATHDTTSVLHDSITLVRGMRREKNGFFLRAESFYNVATEASRVQVQYGNTQPHHQSHGESFLALANHRFGAAGLYILDEPEAALSPQRQLAFIKRMHDLVQSGSQFIIATHSPIFLAHPGAVIYDLDSTGVSRIEYEDTEQYRLTLDFLMNYEAYLRRLLAD